MLIIYAVIIFCSGILVGFVLTKFRQRRQGDFVGTIFVNYDKELDKLLYSLELDDDPEKLKDKEIVIFNVMKV